MLMETVLRIRVLKSWNDEIRMINCYALSEGNIFQELVR